MKRTVSLTNEQYQWYKLTTSILTLAVAVIAASIFRSMQVGNRHIYIMLVSGTCGLMASICYLVERRWVRVCGMAASDYYRVPRPKVRGVRVVVHGMFAVAVVFLCFVALVLYGARAK